MEKQNNHSWPSSYWKMYLEKENISLFKLVRPIQISHVQIHKVAPVQSVSEVILNMSYCSFFSIVGGQCGPRAEYPESRELVQLKDWQLYLTCQIIRLWLNAWPLWAKSFTSLVAHGAGAYLRLSGWESLTPPGWDTNPSHPLWEKL